MSDEKFEFISDDEIEKILGKQDEADDNNDDDILGDLNLLEDDNDSDSNEKMTEEILEELLSFKKSDSVEEFDIEEEERGEVSVSPMHFREFVDEDNLELDIAGLELLYDIPVDISVLLGSISIELGRLSRMRVGSVIPLKKLAGEPVEIYIGDILIAKGETYVIDNENTFGVMITEIVSERERILSVYETLKRQKQM
ncbi:hypothetical protein CN918_27720 [Priestia megaterium]|nr:hypothetical protein CN918_27720 [Priestia megaterium]